MKICSRCNQVVPQTDEEVRAASAKTAEAKKHLQAASDAFHSFKKAHPVRNFWVRNASFISLALLFIGGVFAVIGLFLTGGEHLAVAESHILGVAGLYLIWGVFLLFLNSRWNRMEILHYKAMHNAFILKYKVWANILGLEPYI